MTTDFRALCVELVDCLEKADWPHRYKVVFQQWIYIARKALSEPEPEGPTDEEIMGLMPQQMRDDLAAAARALAGFDPDNIKAASVFRIILNRHSVDHARAVLARWGRSDGPAVPDGREPASVASEPSDAGPAAGEVAELVAAIRAEMKHLHPNSHILDDLTVGHLTRAADLLERLDRYEQALSAVMPPDFKDWWENSKDEWPDVAAGVIENLRKREDLAWEQVERLRPPQPVPVAERLPGPGDCDAEGLCWVWNFTAYTWGLFRIDLTAHSHWLPAHALPLPS